MEKPSGDSLPILYAGDRFIQNSPYGSTHKSSGTDKPGPRDRDSHGNKLLGELKAIQDQYAAEFQSWEGSDHIKTKGIVIEIEMPAKQKSRSERFDRPKYGLELLQEKLGPQGAGGGEMVRQLWFVPDGALSALEKVLTEYVGPMNQQGAARHEALVNSIDEMRRAAFNELWSEAEPQPPANEIVWLEAWLRAGRAGERDEILKQFRTEAERCGLTVGTSVVRLPEHTIVAVRGPSSGWSKSTALLNCVAEIRLGRDYADFFAGLSKEDQQGFADDLRQRIQPEPDADEGADKRVALCVMDTGVNRGHPVLAVRLPANRNFTIRDAWGSADDYGPTGHGTPMAGLALCGDFTAALSGNDQISAPYVLEAVKIVPPDPQKNDEEKIAAAFTQQGVAKVEASAPHRKRVWCVATSMTAPCDGRPSSWSATLDMLAAGSDDEGAPRRLFCISAGNMKQGQWLGYPDSNAATSVEPPGQAWNALCVGSFTDLDSIRTNGYSRTVAPRGGMAPTNVTSLQWEGKWPSKPDVVFQGGNAAVLVGDKDTLQLEELSLLSAAADFNQSPFVTMTGTSPATALAARFAARLHAAYPNYWPETIRGLIVHSAKWTQAMHSMVDSKTKRDRTRALIRSVGYGVPVLSRALECKASRATLVVEGEMQPFCIKGNDARFHQMQMHDLPWPKDALLAAGAQPVRMRVTLSYFVEPNPGNRGYASRYKYAGCQLRFKVSQAGQQKADLEAAVNKIAKDQFEGTPVEAGWEGWGLDATQVFNGSVHSNWWEGSAAALAGMRWIAVYPVTGWWKTRPAQGRQNATIRYALIVTLEASNPDIDLYTPIASLLEVPAVIQV